jgi:hypothetical protein
VSNTALYKSSDNGKTWYAILDVTNNIYSISSIHKIHVSSNGNFLFIITDTVQNYISQDGGNTWTLNSTIIPNILASVFSFSIDGTYGFQLYIDGYIYYTTNYGINWINSNFYSTTPINHTTLLQISDTGDYAILCTDISGSGIQKIYTNRSITPPPVHFRFSDFIADSIYELQIQSKYSNATHSSEMISINTRSATFNITTTSDFTNTVVSFTPPFITFPSEYSVFLYDNNYQLYSIQTISGDNSTLRYSVTISDLSINTYYKIIVSSDYTPYLSKLIDYIVVNSGLQFSGIYFLALELRIIIDKIINKASEGVYSEHFQIFVCILKGSGINVVVKHKNNIVASLIQSLDCNYDNLSYLYEIFICFCYENDKISPIRGREDFLPFITKILT